MRQLLLLTTSFPFGNGEDFLTEELRRASGFDGVVICACHAGQEAEQTKPVPSGMHVIRLRAEPSSVSYASIPLHPEMWSEALRVLFRGRSVSGRLHELAFFRRKVQAVFAALQRQVSSFLPADEIVIYSYWFYDAAMAGALFAEKLRAQGKTVRLISRAHGFDAFPERSPYQYLPFRRFLLNRYDAVRPCSPAAARAVRDAYSARAKKVRVSFLGTVDHGCPFGSRGPVFHVVSCSYLVPVKRLTLLVEALGKTTIPVRWTHIGGGPQEAEIRAAAQTLPENVQWELTGPMPNEELMAFYGSTPVSCLVNVSSSEGLPVSLMEACSFGIPCIATEVGGTPEVVHDGVTGFLLGKNPKAADIAAAIEKMSRLPEEHYSAMCRAARRLWEDKFNADRNYEKFYRELAALLTETISGQEGTS